MGTERRVLFTTKIGSHLWGMDTPKSDTDIFSVYAVPTEDILKGIANTRSEFIRENNVDIALHECSKVVEQLIKGNLNYIIGVMSTLIIESSEEHHVLKEIVKRNTAKNCYHSIHGMAIRNYHKYIESGKDTSERRCNKIFRVIKFGIALLKTGEFKFEPVHGTVPEEIEFRIEELTDACHQSILPDEPDENAYREWLLKLRIKDLKGD